MSTTAAPHRVLVVDDHETTREIWAYTLTSDGHTVEQASTVAHALTCVRAVEINVLVTDVRLGDSESGIDLARTVRSMRPMMPIVVYTGFATSDDAAEVGRLGGTQYLEVPVSTDQMVQSIRLATASLDREPGSVRGDMSQSPGRLVAQSHAMQQVVEWIKRAARSNLPALLVGETGVGKELVAHALHDASARRQQPFVPMNCGAVPPTLIAAELFGHAKGAFTGAGTPRPGLIEEASSGTLFLDEVGELPLEVQPVLLRVLENGELRRLGEARTRHSTARLIAATNRPLLDEVAAGRFRRDLYYRLDVLCCAIPPLRERPEDIDGVVNAWLFRTGRQFSVTSAASARLRDYPWPGNIRELHNVLERAAIASQGDVIDVCECESALNHTRALTSPEQPLEHDTEEGRLRAALEINHWHLGRTAKSLGIDRVTLWRRMRRLNLNR